MTNPSSLKCPQCGSPLPEHAPAGLCPQCLMALNMKAPTVFTDDATAAAAPLPPEQIAPHFPQLEIIECLGRGGMGVVYKARQKTLNRLVALKLLAPERVRDTNFAERFTREAQALAALNHPNIVTIYDFGQAGGFYFLLMEFVDGANLRQLLRTRKFTPEEALAVVPPLCGALQFAHERGIVHRDIKPENLLLGKDGRLKVADFGVAKMLGASRSEGAAGGTTAFPQATQAAGGTPGYSAPEQMADPQHADSRADIYSLGVVFYELLTGELPGKRIEPPSRRVQIDLRLDAVVLRALEKTPELRWQTAADMRTQVEAITATASMAAAPDSLPKKTTGSLTRAQINVMRWKIGLWGFALATAGLSMPFFALRIWTAIFFVISTTMALVFGDNLKMLRLAKRLVSIDGLGVASAAIRLAFVTPALSSPWRDATAVASLWGIAYCLACLTKSGAHPSEAINVAKWTRGKTATVAGAGFILGAALVTMVIEHTRSNLLDESSWALDSRRLERLPPIVALRPNSSGHSGGDVSTDTRMVAKAVPLGVLLSYAYGPPKFYLHWSEKRVVFAPDVSDGKFDFILTVPDHPQEALQAEIKKQLGLVAHRELREADVLVLLVSNQSLISSVATTGDHSSDTGPHAGRYDFTNVPIDNLRDYLEGSLGKPVINDTELTQKFSGSLKWKPQSDKAADLKEIQNVLSKQFGLELAPSREPVEMLIVEKVH